MLNLNISTQHSGNCFIGFGVVITKINQNLSSADTNLSLSDKNEEREVTEEPFSTLKLPALSKKLQVKSFLKLFVMF